MIFKYFVCKTILYIAVEKGNKEIVEFLLLFENTNINCIYKISNFY